MCRPQGTPAPPNQARLLLLPPQPRARLPVSGPPGSNHARLGPPAASCGSRRALHHPLLRLLQLSIRGLSIRQPQRWRAAWLAGCPCADRECWSAACRLSMRRSPCSLYNLKAACQSHPKKHTERRHPCMHGTPGDSAESRGWEWGVGAVQGCSSAIRSIAASTGAATPALLQALMAVPTEMSTTPLALERRAPALLRKRISSGVAGLHWSPSAVQFSHASGRARRTPVCKNRNCAYRCGCVCASCLTWCCCPTSCAPPWRKASTPGHPGFWQAALSTPHPTRAAPDRSLQAPARIPGPVIRG